MDLGFENETKWRLQYLTKDEIELFNILKKPTNQ
jgi:hypothetical protein